MTTLNVQIRHQDGVIIFDQSINGREGSRTLTIDPGVINEEGLLFIHGEGEEGDVRMFARGQENGTRIPPGTLRSYRSLDGENLLAVAHADTTRPLPPDRMALR